MNKPAIILVNPQLGENIGSVARIMHNFAFSDLRIVNPRDGWPNKQAEILAAGGEQLINNAKIFANLEDALADLEIIYACSARSRKMHKPVANLKEHITEVEQYADLSKIGLMFGSERCGLLNEEIIYAKAIITIAANEVYPVLNLSHSVGLVCYEYFNMAPVNAKENKYQKKALRQEDLTYYLDDLQAKLDKTGFFIDEPRKLKLFQAIANIYTRNNLSGQEVKTLTGISKALFNYKNPIDKS